MSRYLIKVNDRERGWVLASGGSGDHLSLGLGTKERASYFSKECLTDPYLINFIDRHNGCVLTKVDIDESKITRMKLIDCIS